MRRTWLTSLAISSLALLSLRDAGVTAFHVPCPFTKETSLLKIVSRQSSLTFRFPKSSRTSGLSPRVRTAPKCSLDFDSVRGSLRGTIQGAAILGGASTLTALLVKAIKGGSKDATLTSESLSQWLLAVTPEQWVKFAWCLSLDIIGAAPELLLPGPMGEALDVAWAPIYAYILYQIFGGRPFLFKTILATAGFLEEALPFTDFIPSATIGWLLELSAENVKKELIDISGKMIGKDIAVKDEREAQPKR